MSLLNILIIDDEAGIRSELTDFFELYDYNVKTADRPSIAFEILKKNLIDIVILDIQLPEMDGLQVLQRIKKLYSSIEVIMITGHGDTDCVIQAMRNGAFDFFQKPFRTIELKSSIERTQKFINLTNKYEISKQTNQMISKELQSEIGTELIGKSKSMHNVLELISKVANFDDTSVLITGESGTGKELVARSIHLLSKRKNTYFYPVNCSAIPENLFESEFFGHMKGSFTGANENKAGWFEIANSGTLFLDEIGDMPFTQQIKLLRVLEDKKIRRIGSHREIPVNVRIIAATNQPIEDYLKSNKFRLDLYHRLNTFSIHIPPLRDRREDIPLLIDYFIRQFSQKMRKKIIGVEDVAYQKLQNYPFTGNVRELKNLIERAVILSENGWIKASYFSVLRGTEKVTQQESLPVEEDWDLESNEKKLINKALQKSKYNKTKAAELLNISWYALNRKIKKFDL